MYRLRGKTRYYYVAAGIILLCSVALFIGRHQFSSNTSPENIALVKASTVQIGSSTNGNTYSGEVRGRYETQLAFQVGGRIVKRNVDLGSVVHAGDVLMQIDAKDIQQTVNIGSAQVAAAESQLQLAANNLNRYRQLYQDGVVGRAVYEQYQSAYDSAVAAVQQANAQYAQGSHQLDYSSLYADGEGVVAGINAEAGQVVGAGQPVITVVKTGEMEVEINVPENQVENIRKASQIKVSFWALPGVALDGKIREVSPIADKVSRTYKVRIAIVNPAPELKLGMTAQAAIGEDGKAPGMYIPLSAIYQNGDTTNVWVIQDDVVVLRPITVGRFGDNTVEVIGGIQPGETIVTAGVHKLYQGQKVARAGDEQ
ncbi:MAG: efflux transporter, family, subunit [Firmicutes bacterium]|nr:efflux transporter, family, subunit [Bacillota bacterium]